MVLAEESVTINTAHWDKSLTICTTLWCICGTDLKEAVPNGIWISYMLVGSFGLGQLVTSKSALANYKAIHPLKSVCSNWDATLCRFSFNAYCTLNCHYLKISIFNLIGWFYAASENKGTNVFRIRKAPG